MPLAYSGAQQEQLTPSAESPQSIPLVGLQQVLQVTNIGSIFPAPSPAHR